LVAKINPYWVEVKRWVKGRSRGARIPYLCTGKRNWFAGRKEMIKLKSTIE